MPADPLVRLRAVCLAFPEVREVIAWGEPTFRVKNKQFAMYASSGNHHGNGRPAVWCKATPMDQELLVKADPGRYFVPAYVGPMGWVGIHLDKRPNWRTVTELLAEGWRLAAPKRLLLRYPAP